MMIKISHPAHNLRSQFTTPQEKNKLENPCPDCLQINLQVMKHKDQEMLKINEVHSNLSSFPQTQLG